MKAFRGQNRGFSKKRCAPKNIRPSCPSIRDGPRRGPPAFVRLCRHLGVKIGVFENRGASGKMSVRPKRASRNLVFSIFQLISAPRESTPWRSGYSADLTPASLGFSSHQVCFFFVFDEEFRSILYLELHEKKCRAGSKKSN